MTVKEQILRIVNDLPDDGTPEAIVEEMQYRLYILRKVQKGLQSIDEGRGINHEQLTNRIRRWTHA